MVNIVRTILILRRMYTVKANEGYEIAYSGS
jgi:hypothetical protein